MRKILIIILVTIISISCKKSTDEFNSELDTMLSNSFNPNEPGGAVLIMKNNKIVFAKGYGLADYETKEKNSPNTIFNLGSISKTFVANGILKLEEEGKLSIEDSIYKYFKDFKNEEIAKKVKIKHLLSHTSGLPDNRNVWASKESMDFFITAKDSANFEPLKQNDSLNFEPGEKYEYSNPGYNGLALIIEKIEKNKWQEYISKNIFAPSNMPNSTITDGEHPSSGVAHGYFFNDSTYVEVDYGEVPTFAAAGNGGVWSSVIELANYEKAIRNNTFLNNTTSKKARKLFTPKNWSDTTQLKRSLAWSLEKPKSLLRDTIIGFKMIQHTGSQGGFKSYYFVFPEQNILYIGLFNKYLFKEEYNYIAEEGIKLLMKHNWLD